MWKHSCLLALALWSGWSIEAQSGDLNYPSRAVRIVVPYTPGGVSDTLARMIGDKLGGRLSQSFVIENRPGAGGIIGSDAVAKAPADGYTILMGSVANTTFPSVYANVPYDLTRDLEPLCKVISIPIFLVVNRSSPYKSVADVIAAARTSPGQLTFASTGTGGSPHLAGELFKMMTGTDILHVAYKGSGPGQIDLLGDRVSMMFDNGSLSLMREGRVRALAVTTGERSPAAPEVPTLAEAGVSGFAVTSWFGLWVPRGTPVPIADLLRENISAAFQEAQVRDKIRDLGATTDLVCGERFSQLIAADLVKWRDLVGKIGLKISN